MPDHGESEGQVRDIGCKAVGASGHVYCYVSSTPQLCMSPPLPSAQD